jgi:hypothetical protein
VIFPALRSLPDGLRESIVSEVRARRGASPAGLR